uniref:Glyco_hydro_1 n=1 Tax=uncultured Rhodoferax sp. TaxID=223188 RepID=A0A060CEA6_9BURK|nr:Glyco_hydro_1 [uncultured Rhodoferax sp.]
MPRSTRAQFPEDFRWGVSTSALQIEGGTDADGRRPSVWDTFAAEPAHIRNGDTPAVACDHYRHWEEDLDLGEGDSASASYRLFRVLAVASCRRGPAR